MKQITLAILLSMTTTLGFAAETYEATVETKTLGSLRLQVGLDLNEQSAKSSLRYFQEIIDQNEFGDFFCINEVKFEKALKIDIKVFDNKTGTFLGILSSDRYDRRKGTLVVADSTNHPESFECHAKDLSGQTKAFVNGYDARVDVKGFSLGVTLLQNAVADAYVAKTDQDLYSLGLVSPDELLESTKNKVQFTVDKDHGHYMNNYEWGNVTLLKK